MIQIDDIKLRITQIPVQTIAWINHGDHDHDHPGRDGHAQD